MMKCKSSILKLAALVLALAPLGAAAWPDKPVRMIVPWAPGGSTDIVARVVAAELGKRVGAQVIVDNRSGAGGILGMQLAAQARADGYTFMLTSTAYGYLIYQSRARGVDLVNSFAPVALLGFGDAALVVNPKFPANSVEELIRMAKAKPGWLNYSSSGIGGFPHMNTELFRMMADVDIVHIPFQSAGQAVTDVIAGNSHMTLGSLTSAIPYIRGGRLKALAVGGSKRSPQLPNVPTMSEAGVRGYETHIWWGVFAPRGTPAAVIARMNQEISAVLTDDAVVRRLEQQGVMPAHMSPAEFRKLMITEQEKWMAVVRAADIGDQ